MPGCRVDGAFISAGITPPENICGQCQPGVSTTSLVPVNEGMACWSGDPNAGVTTCQQGVCAPYCLSDAECDEGAICCSGSCVARDTLDNCGGCGIECQPPDACTQASCTDGVCNSASACDEGSTCNHMGGCCLNYQSSDGACYWMETGSGFYCWVPYGIYNRADCELANSYCDQGGGCYKWATSAY
jgi:hypothetical protein